MKDSSANQDDDRGQHKPSVTLHYCTLCQWQLRAAWMAQEILQTFTDDLYQVRLQPGTGGVFEIYVGQELVWERKRDGGFPGPRELKQAVRDKLCPDRELGHLDSSRS